MCDRDGATWIGPSSARIRRREIARARRARAPCDPAMRNALTPCTSGFGSAFQAKKVRKVRFRSSVEMTFCVAISLPSARPTPAMRPSRRWMSEASRPKENSARRRLPPPPASASPRRAGPPASLWPPAPAARRWSALPSRKGSATRVRQRQRGQMCGGVRRERRARRERHPSVAVAQSSPGQCSTLRAGTN